MRPRVFPAEDDPADFGKCSHVIRFNEAAGIPRGRRGAGGRAGPRRQRASMRPRVFPAEDLVNSATA